MTAMTMLPSESAIVAEKHQLDKRKIVSATEQSRQSILMCLPRGSFRDREKYHQKKKRDSLSTSSNHSRSSSSIRGGRRSSHRITLVEFDLENTREYERYPGLDSVPFQDLWLVKDDLVKCRAEFMQDVMGIIQHEQKQEHSRILPPLEEGQKPSSLQKKNDQEHIFLQTFRHCQELAVGEESDSLDMSLRDALYHHFKKDEWKRVGLVTMTLEEAYRDNQIRRNRMLQVVNEIQQREFVDNDSKQDILRKSCEEISYGPTMFARYLGWSTTKIVYKKWAAVW